MLLKDKAIFIVEDNTMNRVVYQIILRSNGAQLVFDVWGREFLYKLERMPSVDLVILDLMLSVGKTGFDIFQSIRSASKFDAVPIIAVSATEASEAIPHAKNLGFNGYIAKPIDEYLFPFQLARIMRGEVIWDDGRP